MPLEILHRARFDLGEVPVWCTRTQRLFWTDIRACQVHALTPASGALESYAVPDWAGAIALREDGNLLVASRKSLLTLDLTTRAFEVLGLYEDRRPTNRTNDGRCDRQGRFWLGTLNNSERVPDGALYCITPQEDGDVRVSRHMDEIIVPNALSWSPDGSTMYFADSWVGHIWAYDFDSEEGTLSNQRVLVDKDALPGIPDGAVVDSHGCIWNARYGAGQVVRLTPNGELDQVVETGTRQLTACTLGGSDLRDLYVTSAAQRMSEAELAAQPDAGSLFVMRVETPGLPEPRFG